jgi:hypothetical protein
MSAPEWHDQRVMNAQSIIAYFRRNQCDRFCAIYNDLRLSGKSVCPSVSYRPSLKRCAFYIWPCKRHSVFGQPGGEVLDFTHHKIFLYHGRGILVLSHLTNSPGSIRQKPDFADKYRLLKARAVNSRILWPTPPSDAYTRKYVEREPLIPPKRTLRMPS